MPLTRRRVLEHAAGAVGGLLAVRAQSSNESVAAQTSPPPDTPVLTSLTEGNEAALSKAVDERFWRRVRADFEISDDYINLENGYWGLMSRPVLEAYLEHTRRINRDNSNYARRHYGADYLAIRDRVAGAINARSDELVFTRNATEALTALIDGYQTLRAGEAVMFADLDYGSMRAAMRSLASARGARVIELAIPEPTDRRSLVDFYRTALDTNPQVRLLLLTHISNRTGLMIPVRDITAMARDRGVDVILDAAHSWGQIPVDVEDLGADFVGFNLHKWIGAPLGVGLMYIRRERLDSIALASGADDHEAELTRGRVHTGTSNFAAVLSVPDALDYHERIGPENKTARLRYLRSLWVTPARQLPGVEILTPDDPQCHVGITSFRLRGATSASDNTQIASRLLDEFGIFTVARDGVSAGNCVRVTPGLYNTPTDCERLFHALQELSPS